VTRPMSQEELDDYCAEAGAWCALWEGVLEAEDWAIEELGGEQFVPNRHVVETLHELACITMSMLGAMGADPKRATS
jgi:hypothetical protein